MLLEKITEFICSMTGIEDGAEVFGGDSFEEIEEGVAIMLVEALGGFIEDEQAGHFDKCSGNETKALFSVGKPSKRALAPVL